MSPSVSRHCKTRDLYPAQHRHVTTIGNLCLQEWQPRTVMATQKRREVERLRSGMARGRKAAKPRGCEGCREAARLRGMPRGRKAARLRGRPRGCDTARRRCGTPVRLGRKAATLQAVSLLVCEAASAQGRAGRAHMLRNSCECTVLPVCGVARLQVRACMGVDMPMHPHTELGCAGN